MIRYKKEAWERMQERGYTFYKLQKERLLGNGEMTAVRNGLEVGSLKALESVAIMAGTTRLDDLVEYDPEDIKVSCYVWTKDVVAELEERGYDPVAGFTEKELAILSGDKVNRNSFPLAKKVAEMLGCEKEDLMAQVDVTILSALNLQK